MKRITVLFMTCLLLVSMTFIGCNTVSDTPDSPSITPTESAEDTNNNVATITEAPEDMNNNIASITEAPEDMNNNVPTITEASNDNVINVFSATDELPEIVMRYKELHPDFPYEIKIFTFATIDGDFHAILDEYLANGGADTPDIYCIESGKVMRYSQDTKYATPYKDLGIDMDYLVKEADIPQYVIDMGTNPEGDIVSLCYQGTGGAFIYRRSIAKSVWGTDEPDTIQDKIGPGWDQFFEAAADLKAKGYGIVSGDGDIWHSVYDSADIPWVVNDKLYIDPKREAFFDLAKQLKDNGYTNDTTDWTDDWYADMKGIGMKEILGYFGPSWLINYVLTGNAGGNKLGEGTYGDWAVCEPPVGFFWGGTWIYVNQNSRYKEAIGDVIQWITLDSSETGFQYSYANGTYDGNYGVLEAVASGTVMRNSAAKLDILSHQNMFKVFDKAAKLANGKNRTQYDEIINIYWRDQVREYVAGNKTREQAIADFKQRVKANLYITVE